MALNMNFLRQMTVGHRLALAFGVVLLLMLALVGAALLGLSQLHSQASRASQLDGVKEKLTADAFGHAHAAMGALIRAALPAELGATDSRALYDTQQAHLTEVMNKLGLMITDAKEKSRYADAQASQRKLTAAWRQALEKLDANDRESAARIAARDAHEALGPFLHQLHAMGELYAAAISDAGDASDETHNRMRLILVVLAALSVVVAVYFVRRVSRTIVIPVTRAAHLSENLAAGNLTLQMDVNHGGELGLLQKSLRNTVDRLRDLIQAVRDQAEAVRSGADEIASGNAQLSARTEAQASTLEETSASMEEFTTTMKQNAENAAKARALAIGASESATEGGRVVGNAVNTMQKVAASSKQIADIVGVIDGIAFQTNILALNAAVEAARAGEQGRGFAVVAAEVRTLAQRSAQAAKEIKSLISTSVADIKEGAQLVQAAGTAMTDVVESFKRVAATVTQITSTSNEQAEGVGQVNDAIGQMDQATQQNAALVEEVSATAEALASQARELLQSVNAFNLGAMVTQDVDMVLRARRMRARDARPALPTGT